MSRFQRSLLSVLGAIVVAAHPTPSVAAPPNVVMILADDQAWGDYGFMHHPQIQTPHLDRLAADGVVFDNAISTCAVCTPYRAMLVTGRHPQTTGMLLNFVRIRHDEIGIADAFGRAGYRTGWVGKWHMHTGSFPQVQGADYGQEPARAVRPAR